MMSAAPFNVSSEARDGGSRCLHRTGRRPQRIFGVSTRLARCAQEGESKENIGQQCRYPTENAEPVNCEFWSVSKMSGLP